MPVIFLPCINIRLNYVYNRNVLEACLKSEQIHHSSNKDVSEAPVLLNSQVKSQHTRPSFAFCCEEVAGYDLHLPQSVNI